jgi:Xaa-Pro aminopeptidase
MTARPPVNQARAAAFMERAGLAALLAASPANVRYLTGFHCWLASAFKEYMVEPGTSSWLQQQNFALLPLAGDPALVVEPYFVVDAAELSVADVRPAGGGDFEDANGGASAPPQLDAALDALQRGVAPDPVGALADVLAERGLDGARIGIEREAVRPEAIEELRRRLPHAELLDCSNLLRLVRAVKSDEEIARLERAAGIAEDAAMAAFAEAVPGATRADIAAAYRAGLGAAGADFDHFALGVRGLGVSSHAGYVFSEDDVVFADWGCNVDGYFSDTGTTVCFGEPSPELLERHAAIRASLEAGAAALVPGAPSSSVQAAMHEALTAHGVTATFPFGHGFGIESRDYPILVPANGRRVADECVDVDSDLPLEEGMVVNLEVPLFTLGVGSMQTEQSFVLTADGCRPLVHQPREAPLHRSAVAEARA